MRTAHAFGLTGIEPTRLTGLLQRSDEKMSAPTKATPKAVINVGIVEDDDDLRAYLSAVVSAAPGLKLVFAAGSLAEAVWAESGETDVCLIDIQLPDGNGLEFAARLKARSNTKALILTVLGDRESVFKALEAGADGHLLKDTPPDQIVRDIKSVFAGATPCPYRILDSYAATRLSYR